jgi:hypothetical protein
LTQNIELDLADYVVAEIAVVDGAAQPRSVTELLHETPLLGEQNRTLDHACVAQIVTQ